MQIQTPLTDEIISQLRAGDTVDINGVVYTARDQAHRRLVEAIENGQPLPFDIKNQIIYYAGPSPTPPGKVTGSIGPTTSARMDPFTRILLQHGVKGFIGKGPRSEDVKDALREYKGIYFLAPGGVAALYSTYVTKSEIIAYEDLGPEAIYRIEVSNFLAIVAIDSYGGDIFKEGRPKYYVY